VGWKGRTNEKASSKPFIATHLNTRRYCSIDLCSFGTRSHDRTDHYGRQRSNVV